jgi:phosphodiesterase/alkaline phosphatase D-like protein
LFLALSTITASLVIGSKWLKPALAKFTTEQGDAVQSGDVTDTSVIIWARNNAGTEDDKLRRFLAQGQLLVRIHDLTGKSLY